MSDTPHSANLERWHRLALDGDRDASRRFIRERARRDTVAGPVFDTIYPASLERLRKLVLDGDRDAGRRFMREWRRLGSPARVSAEQWKLALRELSQIEHWIPRSPVDSVRVLLHAVPIGVWLQPHVAPPLLHAAPWNHDHLRCVSRREFIAVAALLARRLLCDRCARSLRAQWLDVVVLGRFPVVRCGALPAGSGDEERAVRAQISSLIERETVGSSRINAK